MPCWSGDGDGVGGNKGGRGAMDVPGNVALRSMRWFEGRWGELFMSRRSSRRPLNERSQHGLVDDIGVKTKANVLIF